ncbi:MAG: glycosyltransferase family 9 protein [Puniceicoccales bacterium]|jgi:ADP-heptose:LPS heptosyltransferase|nr:glycosyltransferase family 9 protein [Puniceicoccales bacterium]
MHILVIKPSSLGDIVHGLQVAAIMKKHMSGLQIDWVARDCFADIVAASGIVEHTHLFHRATGISTFFKLLKAIRSRRYDAVLDMQGLARSGLMTCAAKAARKIGRCDSRELSRIFYGERIGKSDSPHALDTLLQFLPKFGIMPSFEYALNFGTIENLCNFAEQYVLLFPESRRVEKQWPFFRELAEELAAAYPKLKIVLLGQNSIGWKFTRGNILDLMGKTSLLDTLGLIKHCALVVANDSAPIHIGAAMQKRIVALFGPTDFRKYGPYPLNCTRHSVLSRRALKELSVKNVFDACTIQSDNFLHSC